MRCRSAAARVLSAIACSLAIFALCTVALIAAPGAWAQSAPPPAQPTAARMAALASLMPQANSSQPTVALPVFSPAGGIYSGPQTVTVTDATPGVVMYYTLDGSSPSTSSPQYNGSITVSKSSTLVVLATAPGYASHSDFAVYYITSVPDSFLYRVAGSGYVGYGGDGGPAKQALFGTQITVTSSAPGSFGPGTAVDASGNIYIADNGNNDVRKVDASTGIITTVAGTGIPGYSGDGGPATSAQLNAPGSLSIDHSGNLYIADSGNQVVRKLDTSSGIITTVAGDPTAVALGDGGLATSAQIGSPQSIAVDGSNNLYILGKGRVREVNASSQIINTVAGGGSGSAPGIPATDFSLGSAQGIALDAAANIYITDAFSNTVLKVTRGTGIIDTFAGQFGKSGYSGDGGPALNAKLSFPLDIAVDPKGNVYFADSFNWVLREVDAATGVISTIGGGGSGWVQDGGTARSALLIYPFGLSSDSAGNIYFENEDVVDMITPLGTPPSTVTPDPVFSLPQGTYSSPQTIGIADSNPDASVYLWTVSNPPATYDASQISFPLGYAGYHEPIELSGSLIVAAQAVAPGHAPSKMVTATYTYTAPPASSITTVAGGSTLARPSAGAHATDVDIYPNAVAMDPSGNLYFADGHVVWKVDSSGTISIAAGNGQSGDTGDNGPATSATLEYPTGIAIDPNGNIFIADSGANVVREVLASSGKIIRYAGGGTCSAGANGDGGSASTACLLAPRTLALDANSNLFISDNSNHVVREVDANTGVIQTVAGSSSATQLGDGGPATSAAFSAAGLAIDGPGNLYIADSRNDRIRKVDPKTGIITTVAGNGIPGFSGVGQLATDAELIPYGVTVDGSGNIIIADENSIRSVDAKTGILSSVAGMDYDPGTNFDGGPASMATFFSFGGNSIFFDAQGNLYFAGYNGAVDTISKITFNLPAPAPTFDPAAGTYAGAQSVTISDTAPNATIYYTTDGSAPTTKSNAYSGAITVSKSETINAIAVASGYGQSSVGSAAYVIKATPTITWSTPAAITYGTALSAAQLDASASVSGTFAYSPAAGTILAAGSQKLSVTFTPTDTTDYTTATGSVMLTVNQATPTIALTSSLNPATTGQSVTFTATVSSTAGKPSGSVTFWDGTTQLGSGTLASGVATYSTTALTVGAHSITAVYSGDTNFATVTSSALAQAVIQFSIGTSSGGSTTGSGVPGGFVTYQLTVTPPSTSAVTFTVAGLPAGYTATFSPSSVPADAGPTNVTLTIQIPSQVSSAAGVPPVPRNWGPGRGAVALGLLLLPLLGIGARRRRVSRLLLVALLAVAGLAATLGLSGCSHNFASLNPGNNNPPPPGSYALTVTATAGSQTQSTTLTLNVQ